MCRQEWHPPTTKHTLGLYFPVGAECSNHGFIQQWLITGQRWFLWCSRKHALKTTCLYCYLDVFSCKGEGLGFTLYASERILVSMSVIINQKDSQYTTLATSLLFENIIMCLKQPYRIFLHFNVVSWNIFQHLLTSNCSVAIIVSLLELIPHSVDTAVTPSWIRKCSQSELAFQYTVHPFIPLSIQPCIAAKIAHPETIRPNC